MPEAWARTHRFVESQAVPWARLRTPLDRTTIALVTTAGVHLRSQRPFDMEDPDGDPTFREVPVDAPRASVAITHKYYDHTDADRDINVVLPIDRLRELRDEGMIGAVAPTCYTFMGHIDGRHLDTLVRVTAPEVAKRLRDDGAGAVVLTPT
jgi:D-proline reductase (dithiol) PrdB